ncbi:MAG TPA: phasin family protein [Noviherbaspirillum sp.]|uniref:phasin family protein n=1 Tax=Noviherbaspirillum sp. TaxID=1926288 RepID=UPI002B4A4BD6|nr:phasin family protein [Noviherbaspirillum sp.]HJV86165.1 phasin family protein [Noviherbaspirillum sp.]
MFPIQDQISVATKANLEANLALCTSLTNKTLESIEKLLNLNIAAIRASMEDATAATRQMLTARDPQEFMSIISAHSTPNVEKAIAYGNHLISIAGATQAEFTKVAEAQIAQFSTTVTGFIEDAARKAPVGSDNMVTIVKTAIGSANNGYEQLTKTARQAVEVMESNLTTAVNSLSQATAVAKS